MKEHFIRRNVTIDNKVPFERLVFKDLGFFSEQKWKTINSLYSTYFQTIELFIESLLFKRIPKKSSYDIIFKNLAS